MATPIVQVLGATPHASLLLTPRHGSCIYPKRRAPECAMDNGQTAPYVDRVMQLLADPSAADRDVAPSQRVCCRLAAESGPRLTEAIARLLRSRLRLAILIILS